MTNIICKICNSSYTKKVVDWRSYEIHKCKNCQLLFSTPDPTPKELDEFYQGFLHRKPKKEDIKKLVVTKKKELQSLFQFPANQELSTKKFLDFGGGTGLAYHVANLMGLDSYYQDIDQDSIKFVKETFGLPSEKFIPDLKSTRIKFDYIFVDNVIEHVIDPGIFVENLYDQLSPTGVIVFKTPNANNTSSFFYPRATIEGYFVNAMKYNSFADALKVYFTKTWHCDPPRHLFSFTKKSFDHMMTKQQIPKSKYSISYYQHPLFLFSFTKSFLFLDREYQGIKSILTRVLIFPVVLLEILSKGIQFVLNRLKLLSPVGIILSIKK
jgi:2-polyprenyl-3-methyl-5-hydroxy-6-metoxy-1,4-benzoquinol methylase